LITFDIIEFLTFFHATVAWKLIIDVVTGRLQARNPISLKICCVGKVGGGGASFGVASGIWSRLKFRRP